MPRKTIIEKILFRFRDLHARRLFVQLRSRCTGDVLDVGGWDFYQTVVARGIAFRSWTTLEAFVARIPLVEDSRLKVVVGDGCRLPLKSASFDTVVNIQVLEHVFDPAAMVSEIGRVLKPGGCAIFLIPQTSALHMAPHHYYNFTRYWVEESVRRAGLSVDSIEPLGGRWASMASNLLYFFLQAARAPGRVPPDVQRPPMFYVLLPLMCAYAAISIPICLALSMGDLKEEPNNHLVIAVKPGTPL